MREERDTAGGREYPETTRIGDCLGSLGPAAYRAANPGEAETAQVGITEARRCLCSDRLKGHFINAEPLAKGGIHVSKRSTLSWSATLTFSSGSSFSRNPRSASTIMLESVTSTDP